MNDGFQCAFVSSDLDAVSKVALRMSSLFQRECCDDGDTFETATETMKPMKLGSCRRSPSPDGSTSAGTSSDSDDDSAAELSSAESDDAPEEALNGGDVKGFAKVAALLSQVLKDAWISDSEDEEDYLEPPVKFNR